MKKKKLVVITGGAKGIGASCAKLFSKKKYNIVILDIDISSGEKLIGELAMESLFIPCDVSKSEEVNNAIKKSIKRFGEIDVLVNNAGIQTYGTVTETDEDVWDKTMNVNVKSHFICAKACIPSMLRNKRGVVISVSSVQAFLSQNNVAAYTTSKTALLGLTRSIAVDYSPTVRAVVICPGTVDTPMLRSSIAQSPDPQEVFEECENMHLVKRVAKPHEIAELIVFVASKKADFITGQSIRVDGGLGITIAGSKR